MSTMGNGCKWMFCYVFSILVSGNIDFRIKPCNCSINSYHERMKLIIRIFSSRFLFRLYWYPLKVLYSTGVVTAYRAYPRGCGLYGFFNSLLWILLGLNIYWLVVRIIINFSKSIFFFFFQFILQLLFRVLTGTANGMQDTREDEDDEDEETT